MTAVAITGATGYLGSLLTDRLSRIKEISRIIIPVRKIQGPKRRHLEKFEKVIIVEINELLSSKDANIDYICHFAACRDSKNTVELADNIRLTENLLQFSQAIEVKGFIYSSSQAVYGNGMPLFRESDPPSPATLYGLSKYASEQIIHHSCSLSPNVKAISLRLAKLVGPSMRYRSNQGELPHLLLDMARAQKKITLPFSGKQLFDFLDVRDAASIICKLILKDTGNWPRILNVGSGKQISAYDVANIVSDASSHYFSNPLSFETSVGRAPPRNYGMSTTLLQDTVNMESLISLDQTIRDLCVYLKKNEL
jgi:nucleoside-diphosphate-sugar epimerase